MSLSEKQNKFSGKSEILLRCSMGRACRIRAKSGIFIAPEHWDDKKCNIKSTNRIHTKMVVEVNECKVKLEELCRIIEEESIKTPIEKITSEWIEKLIYAFHHPKVEKVKKKKLSFFEIYDLFVKTEGDDNLWKENTIKNFKVLKNRLMDYENETKTKLSFDAMDKAFFDSFADYLLNVKKFQNSTNAKTIKNLKWFLKWAMVNEYNKNDFFKQYKPNVCRAKADNAFIVFLNNEELQLLKSFNFSYNERLDKVRDVFLFCCYSGLRYSDVEHLHQKDIYDDMLHVTTIKTDDSITINLNTTTRSILEKYKTDDPNDKALPVLSNQKMNAYLKEMAQIVGINQPVTKVYYVGNKRMEETKPKYEWIGTHTGRRTFICTLLSKGVAPQVVMQFTGHNSYETMKPYIGITESAKAKAMALLDE